MSRVKTDLVEIHENVLCIAIQYIKENKITIQHSIFNCLFDIDEILMYLSTRSLNEIDTNIVYDYYSKHTNAGSISDNGIIYNISNKDDILTFIKKRGYSWIITEYLKLYYQEYIDDFIYKYKHPDEPIVLNHNKSFCFCFL